MSKSEQETPQLRLPDGTIIMESKDISVENSAKFDPALYEYTGKGDINDPKNWRKFPVKRRK